MARVVWGPEEFATVLIVVLFEDAAILVLVLTISVELVIGEDVELVTILALVEGVLEDELSLGRH